LISSVRSFRLEQNDALAARFVVLDGSSRLRGMNPATVAARAGLELELGLGRPINPAIHQSTVYAFASLEELERVQTGEAGFLYYRNGHPNAAALETLLASLEGGEAAASASSGMAAISSTFLALLKSGDHIVADRNVYGGTYALLTDDLPRLGVSATLVNAQDPELVRAAIQPNTRLLHLESLSNPTLRVADLPALIALGKAHGLAVTVDNTFASPALVNPFKLGADAVFHSLAKYIGGHGAVMGGAIIGSAGIVAAARTKLIHLGGTISALDAWLALMGANLGAANAGAQRKCPPGRGFPRGAREDRQGGLSWLTKPSAARVGGVIAARLRRHDGAGIARRTRNYLNLRASHRAADSARAELGGCLLYPVASRQHESPRVNVRSSSGD
jgi:Cys/Met metabolism PLP-dependent enzyme